MISSKEVKYCYGRLNWNCLNAYIRPNDAVIPNSSGYILGPLNPRNANNNGTKSIVDNGITFIRYLKLYNNTSKNIQTYLTVLLCRSAVKMEQSMERQAQTSEIERKRKLIRINNNCLIQINKDETEGRKRCHSQRTFVQLQEKTFFPMLTALRSL